MSKVKVVTDSTNCLPSELIKEYDISVVPVGMVIQGQFYRDLVDITADEFWKMFPSLKEQPTTSAVDPGDFLNTFTELSKSTSDIVCILVSRVLSATQESAYQARRLIRQELPNINVQIMDSKTSSGALGFIALEAARAARQGKNIEEVLRVTSDMISKVYYLAALDTLKYLIKIGRAPKHISNIGEFLQVKPVIGFTDDTGLLNVVARVRGRQKSLEKLAELLADYTDTDRPIHAIMHYTDGPEIAFELKDIVTSRYNCAEIIVSRYSPVMIGATGPAVGLSFYS